MNKALVLGLPIEISNGMLEEINNIGPEENLLYPTFRPNLICPLLGQKMQNGTSETVQ